MCSAWCWVRRLRRPEGRVRAGRAGVGAQRCGPCGPGGGCSRRAARGQAWWVGGCPTRASRGRLPQPGCSPASHSLRPGTSTRAPPAVLPVAPRRCAEPSSAWWLFTPCAARCLAPVLSFPYPLHLAEPGGLFSSLISGREKPGTLPPPPRFSSQTGDWRHRGFSVSRRRLPGLIVTCEKPQFNFSAIKGENVAN